MIKYFTFDWIREHIKEYICIGINIYILANFSTMKIVVFHLKSKTV